MFLGPPEGLALIVLKMLHLNRSTYLDTVDGNHAEPFRTSFLEDKTWSKGFIDFFCLWGLGSGSGGLQKHGRMKERHRKKEELKNGDS